nr:hypothetical protein [Tanacetum cinerariifolium]
MDTTIEQQAAMDEALAPHAQRLRIGRSNFRLLSDIKSKESALQLVYDGLRIYPFFKAFLVTADVPKIYMQEFWAITIVHHHAIRFKMDNKKHIVYLESFRDMLHICPRVRGQYFAEPPFKEEIMAFILFLKHSAAISSSLILRLSQAQILWGLYHKRNVDYAYLMWEDFVYQVEHKNQKKSNEMYYPRFTKAIIHHFMSKDPSIPRRNKVNWHYVKDDHMNSKAYKEYYPITTGEAAPKPKASVRRTRSSSDTSITTPTTAASPRQITSAKGKQTAKASKAKSLLPSMSSGADEGTSSKPGVPDVPTDESEEELSWNSTNDECDDNEEKDDDGDEEDEGDDGEEGNGDDDDADQEVVIDDDKDDEEDGEEERHIEEEEEDELYKDVNINQGRGLQASLEVEDSHVTLTLVNHDGQQQSSSVSSQFLTSMLNSILNVGMESIFETTSQLDVPNPTSVAPLPITAPKMTPSTVATITTTSQAPILPTIVLSDIIQNLPSFGSLFCFDDRLRSLEVNFFEAMQTNQFAGAVSAILRIVHQYMDQQMNEAVKMEVKKILIEKMEGNKSIQCSDEQGNLYKALVKAYESDKIILDTYRETVTLKRRRDDDADKDEEPSAGPDQGPKRHREGKVPESASAPIETATRSTGRSSQGSRSRQASASQSALAEEPMQTTSQMEEPSHSKFDTGPTYELMKGSCKSLVELEYHLEEVFKATTDQLDWVNPEGEQYLHNLLQPLPLIPNNRGRRVIPFKHFINNDLKYLRRGIHLPEQGQEEQVDAD